MEIFQQELGLANLLLDNKLVFASQVLPAEDLKPFTFAKETMDTPVTPDLFHVKSLLVSTGWNLNDDVFIADEVWKSRKTPVDKPTNNEHIENDIVGHIVSTWAVDDDGNDVDDDTDDPPKQFHVCTGAVIYKHWRDPERRTAINSLISEIVAGTKFVSMECFFQGFDYAIQKDGVIQVMPRNESTAFLTKHLRAYGGTGDYNGYKVGRVLKDILFSGKGYVNRPANDRSIILEYSSGKVNMFGVEQIESNSEIIMSAELQAKIDELTAANKSLQEQVDKVNQDNLEATVAGLQEELSVAESSINALKRSEEKLLEKVKEITDKYNSASAELNTIKAEKLLNDRVSQFVRLGYTEDEAKAEVSALGGISDESFAKVVSLIAARPKVDSVQTSSQNVDDGSTADANDGNADAEPTDSTTAADNNAADDDEGSSVYTALAAYIQTFNRSAEKE